MRINLNGKWNLSSKNLEQELVVNVPGSIMTDLYEYKLIDDPYYRDNEYKTLEIFNYDYTYQRDFYLDEEIQGKEVFICFDSIDTIASVYLNDNLILNAQNQHLRYRINVSDFLRFGEKEPNNIKVIIYSVLDYIETEYKKYGKEIYTQIDAIPHFNFVRKAHSMFGWDWGPKLPDGGLQQDVYLEVIEGNKILDCEVIQETSKEISKIKLNIENEMYGESITHVTLYDKEKNVVCSKSEKTSSINHFELEVLNPKRWYPVGYGDQYLYELVCVNEIDGKVVSEDVKKIGLRKMEVLTEKDEIGESFTIAVNDIKIFAKGANYIIEDNFLSRTNKERTRKLLLDAVNCNHNTIRVWGGALYPQDYFFDLCDELGLLVWQDLMFACSYYDATNKEFLENCKEEIICNIKRFRHRACLALICGNNELEKALSWNPPNPDIAARDYLYMFEEFIPEIVRNLVPYIFYWLSSPSSGGNFESPDDDTIGDMHYWGVWHSNEPIEYYRHYLPRFMSEYGLQSFPDIKTIKTFAEEEDMNIFSYVMECHQKNVSCNEKIFNYIAKMFKFPNSFESLIYLSQVIQAEGVRYCIEHLRRNYGRCMGSIYWQLNDCWPVASWSSIDYFGRYKMLQYVSKKAYAPVLLSLEEDKELGHVKININNESLEDISGIVEVSAHHLDGSVIWSENIYAHVKSLSAQYLHHYRLNLKLKEKHDYIVRAKLIVDDKVISENSVSFVYDKHLNLKDPKISYELQQLEENKYKLILKSENIAKYVEIGFDNTDCVLDDNFFNLFPGEEKEVVFNSDVKIEVENIKVKSLYDSF